MIGNQRDTKATAFVVVAGRSATAAQGGNTAEPDDMHGKRNMFCRHSSLFFLTFVFCSLLLLAACATVREQDEPLSHDANQGQISLFMNGPEKAALDITFDLQAVSVMAEDGTYREVLTAPPRSVNSIAMAGRQILLGERDLPEGTYKKIRFVIKEASIKRKDRIARLALPPEGIELDVKFTMNRNVNTSLFVGWNADASIVEGYLFRPVFTVKGPTAELSSLLVYVTNEESNNVSVINRQTGEVVATVLVGKRPRGVAVGVRRDALRVYVANSGSHSLSVINPTTNKVDTEVPIRFGWGAEGVAVARINPDKELVFVTNYSSNNISVIDGTTYQELEKVNVGSGPVAIAADPPVDALLNARSLSTDDVNTLRSYREKFFNVYVVNKNSKDISVVRMDLSTLKSVDVSNLGVEWSPISLGVDYPRGKVYITNYDTDKLSVMDILKFVRGSRSNVISTINNIGISGIGVVADPSFDRVYLLREIPGDVVVIRPFPEGSDTIRAVLTPIIAAIAVEKAPRALLMDPESRKLYVVNRGSNDVSVIDKTTRNVEQIIPVGRKPYGITMFPR